LRNVNKGQNSFIGSGIHDTIFGPQTSVIAGGDTNKILNFADFSTIGGGRDNVIGNPGQFGQLSNIPGGDHDSAGSYSQTVIGFYNKAQGMSVEPFSGTPNSINPSDRVFIIGAGQKALEAFGGNPAVAEARKNAFEVTNDGHAIVYGVNATSTTPAVKGARSVDNTCIAWGDIPAGGGGITSGFGLVSATPQGAGVVKIILNYIYSDTDPLGTGGNQVGTVSGNPTGSAVTATIVYTAGTDACANIQVEKITFTAGHYQFLVHTFNGGGGSCITAYEPFMFHVFARP
jgi:hypothetical protein